MNKILELPLAEKIILFNRITHDYQPVKNNWDSEKVRWLENVINDELNDMGSLIELQSINPR